MFCIVGMAVALLLNYAVLTPLVFIPDECYYHTNEPGFLVELLFSFDSENGYHTFPNMLNLIVTLILGLIAGVFAYSRMLGRKY